MNSLTREKVLPLARSIAAGACAMNGYSEAYCDLMRKGLNDNDPIICAVVAAFTVHEVFVKDWTEPKIEPAKETVNLDEVLF